VGNAEGFARNAVQEIAFDGFGRSIGDGVHQAVEAVPAFAEFDEQVVDLLVAADVDRNGDVAVEFGSKFLDAVFEALVLVRECQLCTFAVAGLGNAVGDGMLGEQTGDQNLLVGEKAHSLFSLRG